jgi:signal transduction histidine kinase
MKLLSGPHRRIRTRLVWSFSLLSLLIIAVFGLFNFLFVYIVEDVFFERLVAEEKQYLTAGYDATGQLPEPRRSFIQIISTIDQLPADMREEYRRAPRREEYAGAQGRHYHLSYSKAPPFILVAEVSEYLVVRQFRTGILTVLICSALVLLLIAITVALMLGNRLARPIESLAALFQEAPASNLPRGFAADYPNNEIGVLAKGMEQAVERIDAFIEREQEFTRDVSHELRTPVAVMTGALELLEKQGSADQDVLRRMRSAVMLMEQNIETLLVLAREEPAQLTPSTALLPLIESVVIDQAPLLNGKPVDVEVTVNPGLRISAHRGMLQILLNNLISNAFQHTDQGKVSIHADDSKTLTIADTGTGIDPAIEDKVFSSFVKGENSAGFGVGLSIVKRLCEHQGWQIDLQSSESGMRVTVTF